MPPQKSYLIQSCSYPCLFYIIFVIKFLPSNLHRGHSRTYCCQNLNYCPLI
ncbi:conserved domain protein [Bacteroides fluxus YIT 12057]|uniref:Conserved domain protein n=1 Tax=Bacteroides fluxus YIT 12057 TaxID=763034 RepID=F3PXH6_9BACE|nr:conserved domain protein [Bacteroides fluxus YIT 12057]